jgi:hypothetical protein
MSGISGGPETRMNVIVPSSFDPGLTAPLRLPVP